MRGLAVGTLALLAVLTLASSADATICHFQNGPQSFDYPCGDSPTAPAQDTTPWYESQGFQAILAVIGLLGSAGAGGYALYRVRKRRQALTQHLSALERAYQDAKSRPGEGAHQVAALHRAIQADHEKGRLDDGQFLELDKRAKEFLVRLRLLDIDIRYRNLPPAFLAEIRHLVGDGVVSHAEADLIEHHAAAYAIAEPARTEIVKLARQWAGEDDAPPAAAAPTGAPIASHQVPVQAGAPNAAPPPAPGASDEAITSRPRPKILSK